MGALLPLAKIVKILGWWLQDEVKWNTKITTSNLSTLKENAIQVITITII